MITAGWHCRQDFLVSLPELCIGSFEIDFGVESRGYRDELAEVNTK